MPRCPTCRKWMMLLEGAHQCPPKWEVWDDDGCGDEYQVVYGHDAQGAGECYAEAYDSDGDYILSGGDEIEVKIRKLGNEEWETYILSAEPTVNYRAVLKRGEGWTTKK